MSSSEIQSFINKFHQLRRAGLTAHLDLDTHAGKAWMGLRMVISPGQKLQKSRNPSYFRRQERRKAAAKAAEASEKPSDVNAEEALAKEVDEPESSAEEALATDKVSEINAEAADGNESAEQADIPVRDADEAENAINRSTAEKTIISDSNLVDDFTKDVKQADNSKSENVFHTKIVEYTNDGKWVDYCPSPVTKPSIRNIASNSAQEQERFSCELCEFKCNSERSLFCHMSTNHAKIEQLDGNVSQIDSSVNVSLGVMNNSDLNQEIVEKPTALPPVSYAEKAKIKVPVPEPIKVEHICDSCDISFKNRTDLKIHFFNEHVVTKEQKSSKKKRNGKKSRQKFNPQPHDEDEGAGEMG